MTKMEQINMVRIPEADVIRAAGEGMDSFLQVFNDAIMQSIGELNGETMSRLNGHQITLLAYMIFREEVMDGGFIQLVHNGYGSFIFENPFARAMREMGAKEFSKLVYKGRKLYEEYGDELTRECSNDEFMALFEAHSECDDFDDEFIEMEEQVTAIIATFVDEHLDLFAQIVAD